jgi:hypothetical protein
MIKIRFNNIVQDKYTGTIYEIGQEVEVTKERFEELKNFDADLVTLIEEVEDKKQVKPSKEDKSKDEKPVDEPTDDGKPVDDASKEDKEEK